MAIFICGILLVIVFGVAGLRKGLVQECVRVALWIVVFGIACLFLPAATERILVMLAERLQYPVKDSEQLAYGLFGSTGGLANEDYLFVSIAAWLRSAIAPVLTVVFLWGSWLISRLVNFVCYLIFFRKKKKAEETELKETDEEVGEKAEEKQVWKTVSPLAGLAVGIVLGLFAGALTAAPFFRVLKLLDAETLSVIPSTFYEEELSHALYRYTGTETLADKLHMKLAKSVVPEGRSSIWEDLPVLLSLKKNVPTVMESLMNPEELAKLDDTWGQFVEDYFSLNAFTEEEKLRLLKHLKEETGKSAANQRIVAKMFDLIAVESKQQVINDVAVYEKLFKILADSKIINHENETPDLKKLDRKELMETLYGLSNADEAVPELLNDIYSEITGDARGQFLRTDLVLDASMKEQVSEAVDVMFDVAGLLGQENLTAEQKDEALTDLKRLQENDAVGEKNYTELTRFLTDKLS